jgi:hypothetical protein
VQWARCGKANTTSFVARSGRFLEAWNVKLAVVARSTAAVILAAFVVPAIG